MVKGYTQSYDNDYQEKFALVTRFNTIRVLLSVAANLDWPMYYHIVKNVFLNGILKEEIYMDIHQVSKLNLQPIKRAS